MPPLVRVLLIGIVLSLVIAFVWTTQTKPAYLKRDRYRLPMHYKCEECGAEFTLNVREFDAMWIDVEPEDFEEDDIGKAHCPECEARFSGVFLYQEK